MSAPRYTVAFILCASHSGGTLLSLLMGAHSKVFSVGAIHNLPKYAGAEVPHVSTDGVTEPCTCGAATLLECSFWSQVDKELDKQGTSLQQLDITGNDPARFRRDNQLFYDAVATVSGAELIVDSSKDMSRYFKLKQAAFAEIRPVYLLRSPHGRVNSIAKYRGFWRATRSTARSVPKAIRFIGDSEFVGVLYEELAREPERELRRIMDGFSLEFEAAQLELSGREFHNIGGNQMRFTGSTVVRLDDKWRRQLSWSQKLMVTLLAGPSYQRGKAYMLSRSASDS